jgi:HK97 family phage major capsid protein
MDQLIYGQLAADYERQLGTQVWNGSGASGQVLGILGTGSIGAVTYTDASPTVPETYLPLAQAVNAVHTTSFIPATAIFMHPRRWNWMTSALDASNRPLVVPVAGGPYMAIGTTTDVRAQGPVGTILGLPVYIDATIPTNLGGGTNEDRIVVGDFSQSYLMEGAVRTRVLPDVLSANLTVRFQLYRYVAFTAGARPTAVAAISGTGLVAPAGF